MKQKGLGRGLDAIFGSDPVDAKLKPMSQMAKIEIADIIPNPTQPRTQFDEEALDELADSIRQLGVIQPVTVKKGDGGKYVTMYRFERIVIDFSLLENLLRFHEAVQRVLGCGGSLHYLLGGADDALCQIAGV